MDLPDLDPDPIAQLAAWRAESGTDEACLVTASADGAPSARMVLVRRIGPAGCEFFTNRTSANFRIVSTGPAFGPSRRNYDHDEVRVFNLTRTEPSPIHIWLVRMK